MEWERIISEVWLNHRGKTVGVGIGLLFGILTAVLGFWKTFLIAACIILGYLIGKRVDENTGFRQLLSRFFGER
ncbi:MAG: DUF2273 domain-containing protein [Bacillota bacterium]